MLFIRCLFWNADKVIIMDSQNFNYTYFASYLKSINAVSNSKILDFGCGQGEIVQILLDHGFDAYGVDIYHQGLPDEIKNSDLFREKRICAIEVGQRLPFEDVIFDVIISNQVFEHIVDLVQVMGELSRILKEDGIMYHRFPSLGVFREGHTGVAFSHWFPNRSKSRYYFLLFFRALGFGFHKEQHSSMSKWAKHKASYLDEKCTYRRYKELMKLFSAYDVVHKEIDVIKYKSKGRPIFEALLKFKYFYSIYKLTYRKLSGMDIELKRCQ